MLNAILVDYAALSNTFESGLLTPLKDPAETRRILRKSGVRPSVYST